MTPHAVKYQPELQNWLNDVLLIDSITNSIESYELVRRVVEQTPNMKALDLSIMGKMVAILQKIAWMQAQSD